jgi:hypothetical protein
MVRAGIEMLSDGTNLFADGNPTQTNAVILEGVGRICLLRIENLHIDYPAWITPATEATIPDHACSAGGLQCGAYLRTICAVTVTTVQKWTIDFAPAVIGCDSMAACNGIEVTDKL